jgi:hypothetical protein
MSIRYLSATLLFSLVIKTRVCAVFVLSSYGGDAHVYSREYSAAVLSHRSFVLHGNCEMPAFLI